MYTVLPQASDWSSTLVSSHLVRKRFLVPSPPPPWGLKSYRINPTSRSKVEISIEFTSHKS